MLDDTLVTNLAEFGRTPKVNPGIARHSETLEELVVYRAEYGDRGLWVRPATMFADTVLVDGQNVPRFRRVEPSGSALA